jgi:hypothetical protein
MNNNRCIILDDSHIKIYSVVNDYEPIRDNEITEQNESINEANESRSNESGTNSGSRSNNNSRISLEVESLD